MTIAYEQNPVHLSLSQKGMYLRSYIIYASNRGQQYYRCNTMGEFGLKSRVELNFVVELHEGRVLEIELKSGTLAATTGTPENPYAQWLRRFMYALLLSYSTLPSDCVGWLLLRQHHGEWRIRKMREPGKYSLATPWIVVLSGELNLS